MAKRLSRWVPAYAYDDSTFLAVDGAPPEVVRQRRQGFEALSHALRNSAPSTLALTVQAREGLSDLQLTGRYRVPFQFSPVVRERLPVGAFWAASHGLKLQDLDGRWFYDLTGSYGVNVLGLDTYKACMAEGVVQGNLLGPVLGGYHPCVADNVARLRVLSGLDEVSFHMSGTEAVMQAVRLARYHTGKRHLVRFAGAYHGWWEDVQPGPGNPLPPRETYTMADMSERSLQVLRSRTDIACVLVNPLQALHPNRSAPADSALVDGSRQSGFDRQAYTEWLQRLRQVCTERGIVLILDEVFVGFRLAEGGAQAYFGVQADMVCYGKTLGGGFPVGVVCGKAALMRRFTPERPADLCLARGTFNAHPAVMAAMNAFLLRLPTPEVQALYQGLDERWQSRETAFNQALAQAGVPVRVAALSSIWTVNYTQPGRYHWLLQYYLRDEGLALSWVGTGRLIFSLDTSEADMAGIQSLFVRACQRMQADGWWWQGEGTASRAIRRQLLKEMLIARWQR
jgi:glutamate-1-semialdehyde 2,1-aminomutase